MGINRPEKQSSCNVNSLKHSSEKISDFEGIHERWLSKHLRERKGEAKRRLEEGYSTGERAFVEKVWWPVVGRLDDLIPEYEIRDFSDGPRFLDFAYVRGEFRICMEVDGYGPHWRDISRRQFADQWMRQNHLVLDGWKVLRFAYDDVVEKPRRCQQIIWQALGLAVIASGKDAASLGEEDTKLTLLERQILRSMRTAAVGEGQGTAAWVKAEFKVSVHSAYRALHKLMKLGYLAAANPTSKRITQYVLVRK